jgi:hypothetical protein
MKTITKQLRLIASAIPTVCSIAASAQMVVTNPTQDYILLESKIEAASNWVKQLEGLQKTIQFAREQANKLDSTKRAIEKGYEFQERVRKETESSYNAVKKMNEDNLAHILQSYLGFSINPSDYLPDMPGVDGYAEFKNSISYDPSARVDMDTHKFDRFLSSIAITDSLLSIDNPVQDYFIQLDKINKLAGAYGSLHLYRRKAKEEVTNNTLTREQSTLEYLESLQDSVKSELALIMLRMAIENMREKINQNKEKNINSKQEQVNAAVRSSNIRNIAMRKQHDLITMYAATSCHYNLNKKFSLRKLAESTTHKAKEKALREQIKKRNLGGK